MNKKIGGAILVLVVAVLSVIFGQDLLQQFGLDEGEPIIDTVVDSGAPADWYEIYFTNPTCPPESERVGGLDEDIASDMLTAEVRVDIAAFDLDVEPIVQALIELEARGVEVRVVTDTDYASLSSINRLRRNGISVREDKRTAFMHNKFVVIDGRITWLGSMNFTSNGVYCNNNNIVRINSPRLAANYTAEMDEMYNDELFGSDSPENTPNESLSIGGIEVENYFGPEKEISLIISRRVARAESEILFMAFAFTDEQIGEALLGRADAGVIVRGVFERVGSNAPFSYYTLLEQARLANVAVLTDGNPQVMHHKVFIIDRSTVIFGSFNFSDNANRRNDENIIIVHDPEFASYFLEEFETVWTEAQVGE
ncbi:phospholipase D-like domain-containing protein [Candidatus Leptofilum sp.]|uniref:phospholipase D-like domain-containing protein n=1 Tax=Candidatus Leptofilum sp. TaxID=3241576 RepID=UPI003B59B9BD